MIDMIINIRDGISVGEIVLIIILLTSLVGSYYWLIKKAMNHRSTVSTTHIIDENRLIQPEDNFENKFPGLGFRNIYSVECNGAGIYICDPTYISDVYNSKDDISNYLRNYGAFLMDFGGDFSSPIWWKYPYALFPLSWHYSSDGFIPPNDANMLVDDIGVDSGSVMFLPSTEVLPSELKSIFSRLLEERNAFLMPASKGTWTLFYEQYDPPQANMMNLYRNIVMKYEGGS